LPTELNTVPRDIQQFFEAYRSAFNALDAGAVARLYAEPSAIAQGGELTVWPNQAAVAENMAALCRLYEERGYGHADFEPVQYVAQGNDYAFVDLRWSISWTSGADPWVFNTSYNLARGPAGWRVVLCTAYTEDKLFEEKGVA
jgi:ketosteroid isomerase-like protein